MFFNKELLRKVVKFLIHLLVVGITLKMVLSNDIDMNKIVIISLICSIAFVI